MSADAPKNTPIAALDACALYYFPEIPCAADPADAEFCNSERFVSGAVDANDRRTDMAQAPRKAEPDRLRVEAAFAGGLEQGRAEIRAAQQAQVDQAASALQSAMQEMARIRHHDLEQMQIETVRLALAIAKKIVGHASQHEASVRHVVRTAMQKVANPRRMTIKLNPKDMDTIREFRQELLPVDDIGTQARLEADGAIERGGCMIETQLGEVDARVDQQLNTIEALLRARLPKAPAAG